MPSDWGYDDNFFRKEAQIGQTFTEIVANYLNYNGIKCRATELEFAKDVADRERFKTHEQDIIFDLMPGCLEVKSRRLQFFPDPNSYPFSTAFVDTVSGWDAKAEVPLGVVLISQMTSSMLVVPPSSKNLWTQYSSYDRFRKIHETWYQCPKTELKHIDLLVDFLIKRQAFHS